ncbi:MAG: DNA mismatch repair protein MutS [Deltaproteobacteria bacterium]
MNQKEHTPAMRQYADIKSRHRDAILFFRMGDFYEMFFEDAAIASRALNIALTSRDRERRIPMCGVPHHSAGAYIARLIKQGHKVAICEQIEEPETNRIVERAVTRIITPGIALEENLLDPKANNYIASIFAGKKAAGFAYMDASTGEFRLTELNNNELVDEIRRLEPAEIIVPQDSETGFLSSLSPKIKATVLPVFDFGYNIALGRISEHFSISSLEGLGCAELTNAVRAAGALLFYAKETQRSDLSHLRPCTPYYAHRHLVIDGSTCRNLEIVKGLSTGEKSGSLLHVLDGTKTPMGFRLLNSWLLNPLKDCDEINQRLDAVEALIDKRGTRKTIQEAFKNVYDLERLCARISVGIAGPRDLLALKTSLNAVPEIKDALKTPGSSSLLKGLYATMDPVNEATGLIEESIAEPAPHSLKDGGVIKRGYSNELDKLRDLSGSAKTAIAGLEAKEKESTGINSIKVGYNRVFGYYIEVTKSNLSNIPAHYIRKQTLANAERFITEELKEFEQTVLSAEQKSLSLEASLFSDIRQRLLKFTKRIQAAAEKIASLDVIASLSQRAEEQKYCKPVVNASDSIFIDAGRHPVVEEFTGHGFVPNDLHIGPEENRIMIITGPNMAGKSTYLRQNAIIVLMAQMGSFVPATSASIGVVDRIFTRIGASDDLAKGQSTFMVEMLETANILNNATDKSLVILDEIGRGTSTFDGLSIAWAVVEYLHDNGSAKTLFATHYHELTEMALTKQRVKNYNMSVSEHDGRIVFLKKVVPGGVSRSYGIHVAEMAGMPKDVIERARGILKYLEKNELNEKGAPRIGQRDAYADNPVIDAKKTESTDLLLKALKAIDINRMTPLEALQGLNALKDKFCDE